MPCYPKGGEPPRETQHRVERPTDILPRSKHGKRPACSKNIKDKDVFNVLTPNKCVAKKLKGNFPISLHSGIRHSVF